MNKSETDVELEILLIASPIRLEIDRTSMFLAPLVLLILSIALGMVMAGTGDLESLRLLRQLRLRIDEDITYGAFE